MANDTLFINIATCLWAFSMRNQHGQEPDTDTFIGEGIVVYVLSLCSVASLYVLISLLSLPKPFAIDIQPRFPESPTLLSRECELRGV